MRIGTSEKCDFSRITELCVIQSQSSLSRTRVGRFFDNAMTLPCNDTHAVSVIVGPTRAHWAQNERTRAARAARGAALRGRPSHVAAAAVQRRARPDCRHDCFASCSSQADANTPCMAALAWFLGPGVGPQLDPHCCPRRMPTGAPPAPHPGHISWHVVARAWPCGTHGHAHAHVKRPGARLRRAT